MKQKRSLFAKRAVMVLAVLFTALTAGATKFITQVALIGTQGKENIDDMIKQAKDQGWTLIDNDLNAGCGSGSDYIYLFYQSEENTDGKNNCYITDFYIVGSNSKSVDKELTFEGRKYKLVTCAGGEEFKESQGDLNRAAGGDYIHLYYTRDPMNNEAVTDITFNDIQAGAVGNKGGDTGYDLNAGSKKAKKEIYMHITKKSALSIVEFIDYSYDSETGLKREVKSTKNFDMVSSNDTEWKDGIYVVSGNVELSNRVNANGTPSLILLDGSTLTANQGIQVNEGNTLNIFAQSDGAAAGKLKANVTKENDSGIGGGINGKNSGEVYILGSTVEARGGKNGAGIGGGNGGSGGTVYVLAGTVDAHGGQHGAGIGGGNGGACGSVYVCSGTVNANGGESAAGIGGGNGGAGGTFYLDGGTVEANGGKHGAGIGGGDEGDGAKFKVYSGTIEAVGGESAVGIGGGYKGSGGLPQFFGGMVKAYGGEGAYGIGPGVDGTSTLAVGLNLGITIYGGESENPTTVIGIADKMPLTKLYRYMIIGGNIRGDANDDLKVDATDLVEMVNAKNDNASAKFVLKNADIDGNGNITQSDIDAVVKIILKK